MTNMKQHWLKPLVLIAPLVLACAPKGQTQPPDDDIPEVALPPEAPPSVPTEGEEGMGEGQMGEEQMGEDPTEEGADVPSVEYVRSEVRRGRCPACELGFLGLKGGDGILSRGRRRLACLNCGWLTRVIRRK